MFKFLGVVGMVSLMAACEAPETMVANAKEECATIGYDIERERVPTLQCTERGYRITKANQRAIPMAVVGAAAPIAAAVISADQTLTVQ